jgi:protein arginine kinase activator
MTISQYKNTSLLGCPTCYETFNEELASIIANVQDNHTQHIGRAPSQSNMNLDRHLQIRRLLKQLESAVNQEEYEHAAELRDKLRELHNAGESHEN